MKASLYKHVRLNNGKWRYCRPAVNPKNHKIQPDVIITPEGKEEKHPEGRYFMNVSGEWIFAGHTAAEAVEAQKKQLIFLQAKKAGIEVQDPAPQPVENNGALTLQSAIAAFLVDLKTARDRMHPKEVRPVRPASFEMYRIILDDFRQMSRKKFLNEINDSVLKQYIDHCKKDKKPITVKKNFRHVKTFLKFHGINTAVVTPDPGEPKAVRDYKNDELTRFFAACNPYEKLIFTTLQITGMRRGELLHLEHSDIGDCEITVRAKPHLNWEPKTKKSSRTIQVPRWLTDKLKSLRVTSKSSLVFPAKNGRVFTNLLLTCKHIAKRAGLNPAEWWLHAFRSTQATNNLRNGMDIVTVRETLGHSPTSLETFRYLAALKNEQIREHMEKLYPQQEQQPVL